jgi:hypothetical protein
MKRLLNHIKSLFLSSLKNIERIILIIFHFFKRWYTQILDFIIKGYETLKIFVKNTDFRKSLYAIFFILIEIFIFSKLKYSIIEYVFSALEQLVTKKIDYTIQLIVFLNANLFYLKLIVFTVLFTSTYFVYKKNEKKTQNINAGFFISLVKGMQAKIGSFSSIVFTIIILSHIAWIGNFLMDGDSLDILKAGIIFMFLILFILLNILMFFQAENEKANTNRILITGLPKLVNVNDLLKKIEENYLPYLNSKTFKLANQGNPGDDLWGNLDPVRKILLNKPEVEKIMFFCSNSVVKNGTEISNFKNLLEQFKKQTGYNFQYEFNPYEKELKGFDADNIEDVKRSVESLLKYITKEGKYTNSDIFFNITTGTSVITSIFTLKAIIEGREAYHIHQSSGEMIKVDLNVLTIQELWDELMDKL